MYNPQLETFLSVANAGSFSKAAEDLFVSSTAIMKQINLLEDDLGLKLFERTHRGLLLTDAGRSLYQDTKYLIQYSKDSVTRARNAMQADSTIIRIGTSPMTPGDFLIELWPKIHEYCPDIKFQLVPFENTPENAREILANLGQNIDIVAGAFDQPFLKISKSAALEISREPVKCAVSLRHKLAAQESITAQDLYGENFMLIKRGWNSHLDLMRDELWQDHPQIHVIDFDFFSIKVFNECENSNNVIMTIDTAWRNVHPLLKTLTVDWNYTIPFGLFHSPTPSKTVHRFLEATTRALELRT